MTSESSQVTLAHCKAFGGHGVWPRSQRKAIHTHVPLSLLADALHSLPVAKSKLPAVAQGATHKSKCWYQAANVSRTD